MTNIENLLPKYYKKSKYMHGLLHPCDVEFDRLYDKLDRTLKNLSVDDADETGIHDFETDFLIPLSDDTLELRRSKIKTKFKMKKPTEAGETKGERRNTYEQHKSTD